MTTLGDDELLGELNLRLERARQTRYDLQVVTRKLELLNRRLEDSERVKSRFVSNIKNEINNPVTSILGLAQQLTGPLAQEPEMVRTLGRMIHGEVFSLDFQLRNIFAAAELESGESPVVAALVDVGALLSDQLDSFSHLVAERELTVDMQVDSAAGEALLFKTDEDKLRLVVANLLSNAIEYNRPQGGIQIRAAMIDGTLSMSFQDTGVGLYPEDLDRIFDRFIQLESGTTKSHRGHGLGLSVSRAAVELMGGSIGVVCEPRQTDAGGCRFIVTLPEMDLDLDASTHVVDGNDFLFDDDQVEAF
ncbi:MAG: HAMP domain-containing histidine kinase [Magnetococcus sp. WYHC-3]